MGLRVYALERFGKEICINLRINFLQRPPPQPVNVYLQCWPCMVLLQSVVKIQFQLPSDNNYGHYMKIDDHLCERLESNSLNIYRKGKKYLSRKAERNVTCHLSPKLISPILLGSQ
jgi:hypothetical protein